MPSKNSNTVAAERRMDLASLFCMIGRHGPAVALAVIAMASVLAGFIIYRTVRGKRRKATGAAADGDVKSATAERDASVIQASPEEPHSSVESTDMSDDGSTDVKEDVDLMRSDLKIRHRRAAAAKIPPPFSPPQSDIQVPDDEHTASDVTEEMSEKESDTCAEGAGQSLQSSSHTVAEMAVEDAADCPHGATDDTAEDAIEEFHDNNSCLKESELNEDKNHEEDERVLQGECQEVEDVITDNRQEEKSFQSALNNPACFEQASLMGENGDDDRQLDNKTTLESNSEEPVIQIEDVPVPCTYYGKDEEFEEENPDSVDCSSYSENCLSPEEENKNDWEEVEEERVDYCLTAQQAEIWSPTCEQETNLASTQQDQCDQTDEVTLPIRDEDGALAGEVIEDDVDKDHSPQFDKQEVEVKQKEENGLSCSQEDGVLCDGADQVTEKTLTSDNTVASSEERHGSDVANSSALCCLSTHVTDDNHDDDGLSGITHDGKAQISSIADFPDLSLDSQQPQKDEIPYLDQDTDSAILGPQTASDETENQPESKNGTITAMAEECNDHVYDPHVQSSYKDQQSAQMVNNEAFDKSSVAAPPDIVAPDDDTITTAVVAEVFDKAGVAGDTDAVDMTPSSIDEEISCPHLISIYQDQESNHTENNETPDETRVNSATDAPACDNAIPLMSEEITCPDMVSSSQDQQSDQTKIHEDFSEVATGVAPVMTEDINPPMGQLHLPSFEQIELRINDISFSSVGEESGISSMAVSPDLQDAGNEFDMTVRNTVFPVMSCDLQPEGQFAEGVAMSVINEEKAGMVFGPYPSSRSQLPQAEHTDRANSFAANEDMFGHEVEDSYHRAMDQFMTQIVASATTYSDELKQQTDMTAGAEVGEIKKKAAGVSVEKKEGTKAEEKEEDYEKTEISIMEATMDNNEWITDSNYQVLPWMNLSATSFAQDHTKTNQPPAEECKDSSAVTDAGCIDATDIPPSTEVKQISSLSLADEITESNKKIVAVQPMHQNVDVTFRVQYFTQSPYQMVAVTGDHQELGNWKGYVPLERAKDGQWVTVVSLPAESHVEWKFVVVDKGEVCRWEECGNRLLDTGYGDDLIVHKWWGFL